MIVCEPSVAAVDSFAYVTAPLDACEYRGMWRSPCDIDRMYYYTTRYYCTT